MDLFDGDLYVGGSKKCRGLWNIAALANTWALWLERDNRIFEDVEGVSRELWERIKYWVALWISQAKVFAEFSFFDSLTG